ncbi:hypothetical protein DL546_000339 [Coniochaeta pulveracea]|uniref:Uncharacterized protein n=1 Tax=Coniochaeta pulveracea TaxID=177199 RepID=A0A420XVV6_9PEZI|nr:hypothetical protein DL546_000339 [Coniochaeta pulveracea]
MLGDPGAAATEWRRAPGVRPLTLSPRQRADGDRGAHALARVPGKPDSPRATHCFPEWRLKESLQRVATAPGPGARRSRAQASHSGLLPLAFFFPLIYPPTLVHAASRASRLRGRKINSDKLICMGKNRNGLAPTQPAKVCAAACSVPLRPPGGSLYRTAGAPEGEPVGVSLQRLGPGPAQVPSSGVALCAFVCPRFLSPPSYTHRPWFTPPAAPAGSGVGKKVPTNPFVWGKIEMDSRPPGPSPGSHAPRELGAASSRDLPYKTTYPILRPAPYNPPCRISLPYKTTYPTLNDPACPRLDTGWARGGSLRQRTY